jgi:electron transport complex protein RnfG
MKRLSSTLPNMFLSLMAICVASAAIVTGANLYTSEPIAASRAAALKTAVGEVVPSCDNDPIADAYMAPLANGDSLRIYPAKKDGQLVGAAVDSYSMNGFNGEIKVIVGFDTDGNLVNYSVLQHSETPGLGSKMEDWFRTDKNKQSVIGRSMKDEGGSLKVSKDGGDVDAITASTITSRAFLDAINRAYAAFIGGTVDASSGASAQTDASTAATSAADATTEATAPADTTNIEEGGTK